MVHVSQGFWSPIIRIWQRCPAFQSLSLTLGGLCKDHRVGKLSKACSLLISTPDSENVCPIYFADGVFTCRLAKLASSLLEIACSMKLKEGKQWKTLILWWIQYAKITGKIYVDLFWRPKAGPPSGAMLFYCLVDTSNGGKPFSWFVHKFHKVRR